MLYDLFVEYWLYISAFIILPLAIYVLVNKGSWRTKIPEAIFTYSTVFLAIVLALAQSQHDRERERKENAIKLAENVQATIQNIIETVTSFYGPSIDNIIKDGSALTLLGNSELPFIERLLFDAEFSLYVDGAFISMIYNEYSFAQRSSASINEVLSSIINKTGYDENKQSAIAMRSERQQRLQRLHNTINETLQHLDNVRFLICCSVTSLRDKRLSELIREAHSLSSGQYDSETLGSLSEKRRDIKEIISKTNCKDNYINPRSAEFFPRLPEDFDMVLDRAIVRRPGYE